MYNGGLSFFSNFYLVPVPPLLQETPQYYPCPVNNPILNLFPPDVQGLIKLLPTTLLADRLAGDYAQYYRDAYFSNLKKQPLPPIPQVAGNQHFHLVILNDPKYVNYERPIFITPERAERILTKIILPFLDKGTGTIIRDNAFIQVHQGKRGNYTFNITLGYSGLGAFVKNDQQYLIDAYNNRILFNNNASALALFQPNINDLIDDMLPEIGVDTQSDAKSDDMLVIEEDIPADDVQSDTESDNEFFDAKSGDVLQNTKQPIELEKILYSVLEIDKTSTDLDTDEIGRNAIIPKPQINRNQANKQSENKIKKQKNPQQAKPAKAHTEKQAVTSSVFSIARLRALVTPAPTTPKQKSKPVRFYPQYNAPLPPVVLRAVPEPASQRHKFLENQLKKKLRYISKTLDNHSMVEVDFKVSILRAKQEAFAKIDTASIPTFLPKVILQHVAPEYMALFSIMTSSAVMHIFDSEEENYSPLEKVCLAIVWNACIVIAVGLYFSHFHKAKPNKEILKKCLTEQINQLKHGKNPQTIKYFTQITLILVIMNELKIHGEHLPDLFKESKLADFLVNVSMLVHDQPGSLFKKAISFWSDPSGDQSDRIIDTMLCLLSIHGDNFVSLARSNTFPEINIPGMSSQERENLMQKSIISLRDILTSGESVYKQTRANLSNEQLDEIILLMNKIFFIYSLRDTLQPTKFFVEFEKEYAEFTQYTNKKIKDFIDRGNKERRWGADVPSIHQFADKSKLFECALIENHSLAIDTLERLSRPAEAVEEQKLKALTRM